MKNLTLILLLFISCTENKINDNITQDYYSNKQIVKIQGKIVDSLRQTLPPVIEDSWVVDGLTYKVRVIDGCEYLYDSNYAISRYMTHKGNCKNKIHYK